MARGINKVILIGNLGADPETRYSAGGSAVTNVRLATNESWRDRQSGEQQERTEWHRVVFFARLAEIAAEYLRKGSTVYVEITLHGQSDEALAAFERAVEEHPEIMECHLMAGEADYLLRVAVSDTADYERVHRHCLTALPGVARARSSFVLRTVCRHTAHRL